MRLRGYNIFYAKISETELNECLIRKNVVRWMDERQDNESLKGQTKYAKLENITRRDLAVY